METEYFGYLKITKSGKYRGIIATLHDVGEPDGDRLLQTQFESELIEDLDDAQAQLKEQCDANNIPMARHPIRVAMMGVWESQFDTPPKGKLL